MTLRFGCAVGLACSLVSAGCTAIDYTAVPTRTASSGIFFTAESIHGPYQSLGVVQLTRKSVHVFGFIDPVGTDLDTAVKELEPKIRAAGADGLANVRIEETPFTTADKVFGAIFFFAPQPAHVTITGELVKLGAAPAPGGPAGPAAAPTVNSPPPPVAPQGGTP